MAQYIYNRGNAALNAQGLPNSIPTVDLPTLIPGRAGIEREDTPAQTLNGYNPALVESSIVPAGTKSYIKPVGPTYPNTWKTILGAVSRGLIGTGSQNSATGNVQDIAAAGGNGADNSSGGSSSAGGGRATGGGTPSRASSV